MSRTEFFRVTEALLQAAHVPFEQRDLLAFLSDCWPWIEADADAIPVVWAEAFLDAHRPAAVG